jgi:DNA-binding transcriptional ArsR family regulator
VIEQLQALSDPTRFAIVQMVRDRELAAGDIAKRFKTMTRPAVSQHLRVLKDCGLLDERRDGTKRMYRIRQKGFESIKDYLESFWNSKLRGLKAAAENHERKQKK